MDTRMSKNEPARVRQAKRPRYLRLAEWLCYFLICLGPFLVPVPTTLTAPRAVSLLLRLGVVLMGTIGLAVVLGQKHKPRL